jgi:poly(A) polymerase
VAAGKRLPPTPWLTAPETRDVIAALTAEGAEVRFVGGCVRDAWLGRPVTDLDLATPTPPEGVIGLLEAAEIRCIPTGIEHGTVMAVMDHRCFEITTLRRDIKTDGRRAEVAFTDDWEADAARRDFTINAVSCTPDGRIYDPAGGLADLESGHVRFVGQPARRIREDFLRILRFFRFDAYYGRPPPDAGALEACRAWAHAIPKLSGERVRDEMLRLLVAPRAHDALGLMAETGVTDYVLPEAFHDDAANGMAMFDALAQLEATFGADPVRRLAALIRGPAALGSDAPARTVAERWRLSNKDGERLAGMVSPPVRTERAMSSRDLRVALYRVGADLVRDLVLLEWAAWGDGGAAEASGYQSLLRAAEQWLPPELPVRGADAIALGLPAGPEVGQVLAEVKRWWLENDFRPSREEALDRLKTLVAERSA